MNLLILGRGKTGSLVADAASKRDHKIKVAGAADNSQCRALTPEQLKGVDVVMDFTTPQAVLPNIEACIGAGTTMVVGTTGWQSERERIQAMVEQKGIGFLCGANFSIGVNLFYDIAEKAAAALKHHYSGQIFERHHAQKKDAPSGTAVALQNIIREYSGTELEITSFREGDVVGMHELVLVSANDTMYLCHDAKSRRGFAEGAVRGAEWVHGKRGFFDFKDIWREL